MFKFLFLMPIVLSGLWFAYLQSRGYSLSQGKQGFIYIIAISLLVLVFFTIAMLLTQ